MKSKGLIIGAVALSVGAAAPVEAQSAGRILGGAAIGGVGGALAGALIPGLSVETGALVGAGAGAIIRATDKRHRYDRYRGYRGRHYYNQRRAYRYYR